jgi:hypothetical protein
MNLAAFLLGGHYRSEQFPPTVNGQRSTDLQICCIGQD